jgi:TetR/AcrR family transcriptional regulator
MYNNFKNLDSNKQKLIVDVAMKEFIDNGFDKASTNKITQNANISKGSLFNYFNNKKGLYTYLLNYSIEVVETFYNEIGHLETDLFKKLEAAGIQKLKTQQKYPHVFDFLVSSLADESEEIKDMVSSQVTATQMKGMNILYENIDESKFKSDINVQKAIEILTWTMFGFANKYIEQIGSFEDVEHFGNAMLNEWREYAEILKKSFYKSF